MAEWPPQVEAPDGFEYLATLLVISTPDGCKSRWEDDEPSAAMRSEVSEFAQQMSMEDLINAPRVGLPDGQHVEQQVLGDTDQVPEGPPEEELRQVAYLRLRVRACTAEQAAVWGRERVMDFEFGPMGAPPEYPRVSINDLFRHAAETA